MTLNTSYYDFYFFQSGWDFHEINGNRYAIPAMQLAAKLHENNQTVRIIHAFSSKNTETLHIMKKVHEVVYGIFQNFFPIHIGYSYHIKAIALENALKKKVYSKLPTDTIFEATLVASQLRLSGLTKKCYEKILELRDVLKTATSRLSSSFIKNESISRVVHSFQLLEEIGEYENHYDIFSLMEHIMYEIIQNRDDYPFVKHFAKNHHLLLMSSPYSASPLRESPIMSYEDMSSPYSASPLRESPIMSQEEMKDDGSNHPLTPKHYFTDESTIQTYEIQTHEYPPLTSTTQASKIQYKAKELSGKEHVYISDQSLRGKYPYAKNEDLYLWAINELVDSTTETLIFNQCTHLVDSVFEKLENLNIAAIKISNCPRLTNQAHKYLLPIPSLRQVLIRCCDNITRGISLQEAKEFKFSIFNTDANCYIVQRRGFSFSQQDIDASRRNTLHLIKKI